MRPRISPPNINAGRPRHIAYSAKPTKCRPKHLSLPSVGTQVMLVPLGSSPFTRYANVMLLYPATPRFPLAECQHPLFQYLTPLATLTNTHTAHHHPLNLHLVPRLPHNNRPPTLGSPRPLPFRPPTSTTRDQPPASLAASGHLSPSTGCPSVYRRALPARYPVGRGRGRGRVLPQQAGRVGQDDGG